MTSPKELKPWAITKPENRVTGDVRVDESKAREVTPLSAFQSVGLPGAASVDFSVKAQPDVPAEVGQDPKVPAPVMDLSAPVSAVSSSEGSTESTSATGGTGSLVHPSDLPPDQETPASAEKEKTEPELLSPPLPF